MKFKVLVLLLLVTASYSSAQNSISEKYYDVSQKLIAESLKDSTVFDRLSELVDRFPARISGSENLEKAIDWIVLEMKKDGFDAVYTQPVMVPKWVRGNPEFGYIETAPGKTISVNICALGGSVSTPSQGIKSEVIEVRGIDELKSLDPNLVKGKIVFFNRPMQADLIHTFEAYGHVIIRY